MLDVRVYFSRSVIASKKVDKRSLSVEARNTITNIKNMKIGLTYSLTSGFNIGLRIDAESTKTRSKTSVPMPPPVSPASSLSKNLGKDID